MSLEQTIDRAVQSRLRTDSRYRYAQDAQAQAEAEREITNEVVEEAIYGRDLDHPCTYGHFDCASYERGPCANELWAKHSV